MKGKALQSLNLLQTDKLDIPMGYQLIKTIFSRVNLLGKRLEGVRNESSGDFRLAALKCIRVLKGLRTDYYADGGSGVV